MEDFLKSDCKNCFGLCCVALPYAKSADFPADKAGGEPCHNLCVDNRCSIHNNLREKGFRGCVSYECFGAGQHVSQFLYEGRDWRNNAEHSSEMFTVFPLIQQLHEMLWYLYQSMNLKETKSFQSSLQAIYDETIKLTKKTPDEIINMNITLHRSRVNDLLIKTSELYRKKTSGFNKRKKGRNYIGANLEGANLIGANFRGVLLIASNLRNADLRKVDFIGADMRDADISGANLTDCLFLTQSQINSAKGNIHTKLPSYLEKPDHWLK
ncbi:pentapeptide repeat-containing protein [Ornithinibacillus sp. L9]|uniref:Pentapeptide repeat-containing protein n=1 Tax=Ornithinibacillus caprae TaxID=2678566 RepID=A0A6N8FMF2_9BACI|nr:pentapeptide repeat-containing protein [Ornithinibacillus caprae]MUK88919.1 pentapeptide repeat-containing protein [Ornithinibacillus caprae]